MKKNDGISVSIITRTRGRPLLLPRTLKSIYDQSFNNYEVVIVNDGGNEAYIKQQVETIFDDNYKVKIVSNSSAEGRWHTARQGVDNSLGKYIVLLDDDDTWHKNFLDRTVKYLDDNKNAMGVVVESDRIEETVDSEGRIRERGQAPLFRYPLPIRLFSMINANCIPTNGFVFRRDAYNEIGGYDNSLPVLGDWDFNLRFGLKYEFNVIAETLAYIHHRPKDDTSSYSNTVVTGVNEHYKTRVTIMNRFLRKDIAEGSVSPGYIMNVLDNYNEIRHEFNSGLTSVSNSQQELLKRLEVVVSQNAHLSERLSKIEAPIDRKIREYISNLSARIRKRKGL